MISRKPTRAASGTHECPRLIAARTYVSRARFNGPAIHGIERVDGQWWANSDDREYSTAIAFCPFCGRRL